MTATNHGSPIPSAPPAPATARPETATFAELLDRYAADVYGSADDSYPTPDDEVAASRSAVESRVATLEARLRAWEHDAEIAAGECLVPIPEPGTDMSRLLLANGQMRRQRDAAERDAGRWRAIVGCQRVRLLGYARLGQPDQHIGFELWEEYPPDDIPPGANEMSRDDLTTFADTAATRAAPRGDDAPEQT